MVGTINIQPNLRSGEFFFFSGEVRKSATEKEGKDAVQVNIEPHSSTRNCNFTFICVFLNSGQYVGTA